MAFGEKVRKVFSNDVRCLYNVILKLNSLNWREAYLSKLDVLKAKFITLIPFTKDAIIYAEQRSKFFMNMALIRLPPELDFVRTQISLGSTLPNY